MLAKVWTCAIVGLGGDLVQVRVDIARQGLTNFTIVGLGYTPVQEARERGVKTAFVPAVDAAEAALVDGIEVIPVTY